MLLYIILFLIFFSENTATNSDNEPETSSSIQKIEQEQRDELDIPKGIVKWLVEILDETDEPLVGIATILTMVKKKEA